MSAGTRSWKCPECGREVQLSVTQLDPMACDECLAKMKGGKDSAASPVAEAVTGPMAIWQALPEMIKLGAVVVALVIGLLVGYIAGQATAPHAVNTTASNHSKEEPEAEEPEERPPAPGPGYKWVRGRTRKDGTRGPSHWAKDPFYKGEDAKDSK